MPLDDFTIIQRELASLKEQSDCLSEVKSALLRLQHYQEGLCVNMADEIEKLTIKVGTAEMNLRKQIASFSEKVAGTLADRPVTSPASRNANRLLVRTGDSNG
jgi:protein-disulfide isomerase-like protein with CxxC motif